MLITNGRSALHVTTRDYEWVVAILVQLSRFVHLHKIIEPLHKIAVSDAKFASNVCCTAVLHPHCDAKSQQTLLVFAKKESLNGTSAFLDFNASDC